MSELQKGEVSIKVGEKEYILRPTIEAFDQLGNLLETSRNAELCNLNTAAAIIRAGSGSEETIGGIRKALHTQDDKLAICMATASFINGYLFGWKAPEDKPKGKRADPLPTA